MKKHILFVIESLNSGGAERSLVSLLKSLDKEDIDISLQLFKHEGLFLSELPKRVNLLPIPDAILALTTKMRKMQPKLLFQVQAMFCRIQAGLYIRTHELPARQEVQSIWKWWKNAIPQHPMSYDAVVAYLQTTPLYFAIDKVHALKKISWIHSDYISANYSREIDAPYFTQVDEIVTVSDSCKRGFLQAFPEHERKTHVIENIISKKLIGQMAEGKSPFTDGFTGFRIMTTSRLSHEKGIDLAIAASAVMKKAGVHFRWYVIGKGPDQAILEKMIKDANLVEEFVLLGERANPYPYVRNADLYVQPSRYEGKCISIEEAKLLQRPIVATNYETVGDQLTDGQTGIVCNMDETHMAESIMRVLEDEVLRNHLTQTLRALEDNEQASLKAFLTLI